MSDAGGPMRTLIVYYGRSGPAAMIAAAMARSVGAALRELADWTPGSAIRVAVDIMHTRRSANRPAQQYDLSGYDTVALLTPVQSGHPPVTAHMFLRRAHLRDKRLLIVAVGAGVENRRAVERIERQALFAGASLLGVRQVCGAHVYEKSAPCPTPEELSQIGEQLAELLERARNREE